jgi:hypothetical protein
VPSLAGLGLVVCCFPALPCRSSYVAASRLKFASGTPYTAALWLKHLEMFSCDPREIPPSAEVRRGSG